MAHVQPVRARLPRRRGVCARVGVLDLRILATQSNVGRVSQLQRHDRCGETYTPDDKAHGREHRFTIHSASNYVRCTSRLRSSRSKVYCCAEMAPVAQRVLGESNDRHAQDEGNYAARSTKPTAPRSAISVRPWRRSRRHSIGRARARYTSCSCWYRRSRSAPMKVAARRRELNTASCR